MGDLLCLVREDEEESEDHGPEPEPVPLDLVPPQLAIGIHPPLPALATSEESSTFPRAKVRRPVYYSRIGLWTM